ncbi:MAG: cobalamin-binding protein [Spirochaetia bacterium]|jgi:hypothetical protein
MEESWSPSERLGIIKPSVDAHVLGVTSIGELLAECGREVAYAAPPVCSACDRPEGERESAAIEAWIREERLTRLGFSYRLSPEDGVDLLARLTRQLERRSLFSDQGGPLRALYFAGLPQACRLARERVPRVAAVFDGEETHQETLARLGLRMAALPPESARALAYDSDRLAFGEQLIDKGDYLGVSPPDRSGYPAFGGEQDSVVARLGHAVRSGTLPLYRAHMGQYLPDREEAVRTFMRWTRELAALGHLDVLSIGNSQLSQSRFGEDWGESTDGGGVPLNSREELAAAWRAARPMLVRSYAGTKDLAAMARINDQTIHNAWHALSVWWFCAIDNRGPYPLRENLQQQHAALRYIASAGKPFEPNVPHHFAFRGADDATYVLSGYIAARAAKEAGVRVLIAQNMLNTPKYTWGVQDLAKSRALLRMLRGLEDGSFTVVLQTRTGLDYLSADPRRAKAQLAAVTALMDDIEPRSAESPGIIHVVSWTEATRFADPAVITESVQICRHALAEYRGLRKKGLIDDAGESPEVKARTEELVAEAQAVLRAIETSIEGPWTPAGLYGIFAAGFLPVPYLWACRGEFPAAIDWRTRLVRGAVRLVDEKGVPLSVAQRVERALGNLKRTRPPS